MPICSNKDKNNPVVIATDVEHEAAEIAKVKISREQAYFNSYDFDAIEEASIEAVDKVEEVVCDCDPSRNRTKTPDINCNVGDRDDGDIHVSGRHQVSSDTCYERLTSYLESTHPTNSLKSSQVPPGCEICLTSGGERRNFSSSPPMKLYGKGGDELHKPFENIFSLPRAMLKCAR
ncbi:unnamed protein product [Hermetia illucens]|uniref:Uncharacterized protein n=1 Tax=Hermetia illucens TaxID=343691 RepID=A0A7R8Z1I9_HERIL|nr:unnamed protein product [Hermetia illucens]